MNLEGYMKREIYLDYSVNSDPSTQLMELKTPNFLKKDMPNSEA